LETGRLNRPFKQFNASELQAIEIDDKLETLCTRLSNSLKNRDDAEVLELLEELKEVARSASSNSAIDTRQAVAAALEWLRFSKSGSMPNWKLISGYNDGFLVRNILDDSFAQKNVSVLKSAVQNQAHLRNTATKRRLLRAACEVLVENVNSVAPAREGLDWIHALYELNFQALDELGDELWQRCSQAIVATRRPWDRQLAEEMLLYRPSFVEADPLWAHIDIRSCLDDLPEARRRLIKWEGKLDQSLFEALEEEIFLYEYGLGWLSTASRNLAMKVFRSRPFTEPALISALSEPPVVADTFRHLTELCGLISDVKLDEVRHLSKPKAINASALVALVASAVNASNEGLTRADEKLKTAMHPSGAEGVKL
jgi:hypothetical protein